MIAQRLKDVLSPVVAGRVYPIVLPDDVAYPAIVYSHSGITEEPFVDAGQLIQRYAMNVRVYSKSYSEAVAKRGQIVTALRAMPEFIEQEIDFDGFEPDTKLFFWTLNFSFRDLTQIS